MIRVLHVLGALNCGGAENFIMNIYRNIDRTKIQFDFVIHTNKKCFFTDEIIKLGGKIYTMPKYRIINDLQYVIEWKKFFNNHSEYKIIHGHMRSTAAVYLKIAKSYGLYTIAHSHSISSGNGIQAFIKNIFQKNISKYTDFFMGCSQEANEWLFGKDIADSNKCRIIDNGIEVKKFKFDNDKRKEIRKELNVLDDEVLIGNVGRFSKVKNHDFIIKLFSKIYRKNKKYKLILIGEGEEKDRIMNLCNEMQIFKSVIFLNTTAKVYEYLSAMDLFIMPSLYEGFGMALIEAQISGLTCIASENIPKATKITSNVQYLPLNEEIWEKEIKSFNYKKNRKINMDKRIEKYDCCRVALELQDFYLNKS